MRRQIRTLQLKVLKMKNKSKISEIQSKEIYLTQKIYVNISFEEFSIDILKINN